MNRVHPRRPSNRDQRGVYAVEFALVFVLFFSVLYGIIGYGMLLTFRMGLQNAAEDGARAALRYQSTSPGRAAVAIQIAEQRSRWMPSVEPPTALCSVAGAEASVCDSITCTTNANWDQRCRIIVTVKARGMELLLPPMLSVVFPSEIAGQASMLLDGSSS